MKKYVFGVLALLMLCVGLNSKLTIATETADPEVANFQGSWVDKEEKDLSFSLDLRQEGTTLTGYHCGVTKNAKWIDCSSEGEDFTIDGTINGNIAKVKFTSAYSGKIGMAKITHNGESLLWEITAFPNGPCYLPDRAILAKGIIEDSPPPPYNPIGVLENLTAQDLRERNYQYEVELDSELVIYDDFNGDEIIDIATVFCPFDEHIEETGSPVRSENRFLAVGFGDKSGEIQLVLNEQAIPCLDCGGAYGVPEVTLASRDGVIIVDSYGGSTWEWWEEQKIRYENGKFRVIGYSESSLATLAYFEYDLNFNTLEAVRKYRYREVKEETGEIRFKNFVAQQRIGELTIDGKLDEDDWKNAQTFDIRKKPAVVHKPENWSGAADLSFSAATLWDAESLYIGVNVTDEKVISVENWEKILKGEHLELWFDFSGFLVEWENMQLRQKPDASVAQIGVGLTESGSENIIRFFYPEKPNKNYGITSASALTENGYQIEVQIPFSILQEFVPEDYQWAARKNFGFTIVVSDTDNPSQRKQDCLMATSEVQWGNPYTFGACYLFEHYEKPDYPLKEWRARY
jgi:hypothetical protein